nr:ROK family protein [Angustibacter aerolatus]
MPRLTERSGLTPGAVTKALSPLIASGHVRELAPQAPAGRGRPRVPLALVADREHVLGVKVTHEEVVGVRTDLRAQVLDVVTEPLAEPSVAAVVDAVTRIARALGGPGVHRLGVAVSGDVDSAHGTVRYSPFLRWRDVPLGRLLAEATGLSVVLEHDVRALAHEERLLGAGRGLRDFAVVTIGTGIGCALVVDGSPVPGAFGVAGEPRPRGGRPSGAAVHLRLARLPGGSGLDRRAGAGAARGGGRAGRRRPRGAPRRHRSRRGRPLLRRRRRRDRRGHGGGRQPLRAAAHRYHRRGPRHRPAAARRRHRPLPPAGVRRGRPVRAWSSARCPSSSGPPARRRSPSTAPCSRWAPPPAPSPAAPTTRRPNPRRSLQ